jgi:hypothetical protein
LDSNSELDREKGYRDENGEWHGVDQDEKLFKENEKLLERLTNAAHKHNMGYKLAADQSHSRMNDVTVASASERIIDISHNSRSRTQVKDLAQD